MTVQLHETRFGDFYMFLLKKRKKQTTGANYRQSMFIVCDARTKNFFGEECDSVTGIIKNTEDTSYLMDWAMNLANKTGRAFAQKKMCK